jgi:hypothetical protein
MVRVHSWAGAVSRVCEVLADVYAALAVLVIFTLHSDVDTLQFPKVWTFVNML